jgi:hypothetical protein
MARKAKWDGSTKNKTFRLTLIAEEGLNELAESLALSTNEMIEIMGRAAKNTETKKAFEWVLTKGILQVQNDEGGSKNETFPSTE